MTNPHINLYEYTVAFHIQCVKISKIVKTLNRFTKETQVSSL